MLGICSKLQVQCTFNAVFWPGNEAAYHVISYTGAWVTVYTAQLSLSQTSITVSYNSKASSKVNSLEQFLFHLLHVVGGKVEHIEAGIGDREPLAADPSI